MSDDEIIGIVSQEENSMDISDESVESVEVSTSALPPSKKDLIKPCDTIRNGLLTIENVPYDYFSSLSAIKATFAEYLE